MYAIITTTICDKLNSSVGATVNYKQVAQLTLHELQCLTQHCVIHYALSAESYYITSKTGHHRRILSLYAGIFCLTQTSISMVKIYILKCVYIGHDVKSLKTNEKRRLLHYINVKCTYRLYIDEVHTLETFYAVTPALH